MKSIFLVPYVATHIELSLFLEVTSMVTTKSSVEVNCLAQDQPPNFAERYELPNATLIGTACDASRGYALCVEPYP